MESFKKQNQDREKHLYTKSDYDNDINTSEDDACSDCVYYGDDEASKTSKDEDSFQANQHIKELYYNNMKHSTSEEEAFTGEDSSTEDETSSNEDEVEFNHSYNEYSILGNEGAFSSDEEYYADNEYEESDDICGESDGEYNSRLAFSKTGSLSALHLKTLEELSQMNKKGVDNCIYTSFRVAKFLETDIRYRLIKSESKGGRSLFHAFESDITNLRKIANTNERISLYLWQIPHESLLEEMISRGSGTHAIISERIVIEGKVIGHAFNMVNDGGLIRYIDTSHYNNFKRALYNEKEYLSLFQAENKKVDAIIIHNRVDWEVS